MWGKVQEALQVVDDRVEGAVLVIGRATKLDAGGVLGGGLLFECLQQARFADARLAAQ